MRFETRKKQDVDQSKREDPLKKSILTPKSTEILSISVVKK